MSKGASPFKAEEFTDISELQALCTVLGPYGLKQLSDEMMQCVSSHMTEIKVREGWGEEGRGGGEEEGSGQACGCLTWFVKLFAENCADEQGCA